MTVSSTSTSVSYTGDASTTSFPVTFAFFGTGTDAEIIVIERVISTGVETTLANGTNYTVTGGSGSTGTVVATSAPAATKRWTIERATARTQETDYVENDPFPAEIHEAALDRLTMIGQEGYNLADRSFKFAASSSTTASTVVPDPTASTVLVWNAGGTALENGPTTTEISTAQTYATNASNSATSASNSASTATTQAGIATTQAGLAATAKTGAETAETNAETAQAAAEAAAAAAEVAKIEWQGAWSGATSYALNDAVSYGGSSWICVQAHTNQTPADTAYWDPLAVKGTDGSGGTVTSIIAGTGLTGGTITSTGTIAVDTSVVATLNTANVFSKQQTPLKAALTDAATVAWDCSAAQVATLTTGAARTMGAPTNGVNGTSYRLVLTTGGYTPSWNAAFKFPGGTVPSSLTGTCVFDFHYDGTNFLCVGQNTGEA